MYYNKISKKITVSRAVMNGKVQKKIRLYTTSSSVPSVSNINAVYDVANDSVSASGWYQIPSSDSADIMYFTEATIEYNQSASTVNIPNDSFSPPARYDERYITVTTVNAPIRNDRYASSTMQRIKVQVNAVGFISTPTIKAYARRNGLKAEEFTVEDDVIKMPYNNAPAILVVEVWIGEVCITEQAFEVTNKTGGAKYVGKFTRVDDLIKALENKNGEISVAVYMGSRDSNNATGKTLDTGYGVYFNGNGYNVLTPDTDDPNAADVALQVVADATENGPILGPVSWFNRIIANSIKTNDVEISEGGMIRSGYSIDGTLNAGRTNGFWISGTGQMKAVGAQFDRVVIDDTSTLNGDVNHNYFKTTKGESTAPFNYEATQNVYSIFLLLIDLENEVKGKSYTAYRDTSTPYGGYGNGSSSYVEYRKYAISGKFDGNTFSYVTMETFVNFEIRTPLTMLPTLVGTELKFISYSSSQIPSTAKYYVSNETWFRASNSTTKYPTTKLIKKSDMAGLSIPLGGSRTLYGSSKITVNGYFFLVTNGSTGYSNITHTFEAGATIDYVSDGYWRIKDSGFDLWIRFNSDYSSTETGFVSDYIYSLKMENVTYKTADAGILTANVTPLEKDVYNLGAELTPFLNAYVKKVNADEVHGKVYFS